MMKMEDSGIDSDSRSNGGLPVSDTVPATSADVSEAPVIDDSEHCCVTFSGDRVQPVSPEHKSDSPDNCNLPCESSYGSLSHLMSSSRLQKRLEKQILQAKKIRQKEQNLDNVPKKLIPRNRLRVPKSNQVPIVTKSDSHPLVSWETDSEDDEFDFLPASKKGTREITQQLIKDGFNLDLTPDDEDLDLIPPKPFERRCVCCTPHFSCVIQ